ncbi:MAG: hypothetical protein HKK67_10530 [Chlorobiaceae bacterium]|nr:hypothetical protein [Chlorobiaceae bacterium]
MSRQHSAFAIPHDLPPNVQICNARRQTRRQQAPNADTCECGLVQGIAKAKLRKRSPSRRSAAPGKC